MADPLPLIDAHLHLWDPKRIRYSWLDGNALLGRAYLPADLTAASAGLLVEKVVFVECGCDPGLALEEARWVSALAKDDARIAAIVAHAPVELGGAAVREHLASLHALPLVTGVRRLLQGDRASGFCTSPAFVDGVQSLAFFNFSFDLCIVHDQLPDAIELVRRCPQVSFILDHCGKPDVRAKAFQPWADRLRELARLPNVACKLSGLVTEADHEHWTAADLAPYIDHVIACFGPTRVMFGGDWPVVLGAATYRRWVETFRAAIDGLDAAARARICSGTAEALYLHDLPRARP
jgi:L-fuconolactonase